jgi:hypothetical protein
MGSGLLDPGMTTTQLICGDVMHVLWVRVSANHLNYSCKQWVSNITETPTQVSLQVAHGISCHQKSSLHV